MNIFKATEKPVEVNAIELKYSTTSQDECIRFCGGKKGVDGSVLFTTHKGIFIAKTGDYIVRGENGEFHIRDSKTFLKTYDF